MTLLISVLQYLTLDLIPLNALLHVHIHFQRCLYHKLITFFLFQTNRVNRTLIM